MFASLLAAVAIAAAPVPGSGVHTYQGVVISPQGDRVASVDGFQPFSGGDERQHAEIVIRSAKDGAVIARLDPCKTCRYAGLAWSPDGAELAFVATDRKAGTAAIDVAATSGAARMTRTLTTVKGLAETPRWSPTGDRVAFLGVVGAHKEVGATQAGVAQVGEIGSVVDEQRIFISPAAGGEAKAASPGDTWVYEYDWTPDGQGFVATAARGDGDNNWWVAKLVAVDAATGAARVLASPKYQMNCPRVSPDGRTVAFIGGLMSDYGSVGGDLYTVPLSGGEPRDITTGFKGTFTSLVWRGPVIRATALIGADFAGVTVDPAGSIKVMDKAPFSFAAGDGRVSLSADGSVAAATVQDFERAPELYVHGPQGPHPLTHDNAGLKPAVRATSITWKSGPYDVQGWLLAPLGADPKVKHPMITLVHGGPSAAVTPSFVSGGAAKDLLDHGYYVFQPNPRGSYGQGEAFTVANVKDFGGGDLTDIMAGIDQVEKVAPLDENRLGVMGHSYGGFMTMWTVTHTNRFKAAVAGAGIANWSSYYGENGIDQWMVPFFGATFYDDPAVYDRLSPIRSIRNAKTPTFIYVGERDVECPAAQSLEFHHGLDAMGVPNSLVILEGEGHGIRKPEHQKELKDRTLAWFDKYLK